ncbi:MAG: fused MFS/spermidine synthase [Calditrichaeota bacterium]|nr:fused MFS/spermidine synthase [Calditrichota bacterium]
MTEQRNYRLLVYGLFLLSGISGLIYQIVWTRMLVLVFGNTMLATATVLSAFMGGLAAGSYVLGRYIDSAPRPLLKVYALLEAGIGLFALIFPLVLDAATPLYAFLFRAVEGNIVSLNLTRFLVCFLIIGVPTFLMGGTLPVLIKRFTRAEDTIGSETGFLYGLNTVGAVLGTFACGYFLLRELGMQHTTWIGVAINLGVAALAWMIGAGAPNSSPEETISGQNDDAAAEHHPLVVRMVLIAIGISGFCALAYEVFWTRMLNLFLHNNIYSFTAILGTFLIGIAVGSLLYARFLSRSSKQIHIFIALQVGIGVISYATPFIFKLFHGSVFNNFDETMTLVKTAVIMIGPTLMMGVAVPLAIQICRKGANKEGTSVGTVYAVNTFGAILGAFIAGFVLLPEIGLQRGILLVASLNLIAAVLPLLAVSRPGLRPVWTGAALGLIALAFLTAPQNLFKSLFQEAHPYADIEYYQEGKVANVVVYDFKTLGYKDFHLNAVNEASSRLWHVQLFKLLGLLPTVLHDDPDDALMIAFGAGMSAGATASNVKSLEVVDLNPDIRGIAEAYTRENLDVYHQPNFTQVVNDGRNALLLSDRQYSMIISDATNPKMFDSWTLYSREFYELVKSRMKPGGIFCQWALIPLPADAIDVIFNTFRTVFPHASIWVIHGSSQILMLATPERLSIDYADLSKRLEPLYEKSGLAEFGITSPEKFLSFFTLGEDGLARMLEHTDKVSTDDLPYAQFIIEQDSLGIDRCLDLVRFQESIRGYMAPNSGVPVDFAARMDVYEDLARRLNVAFLAGEQMRFAEAEFVCTDAGLPDANVAHHLNYCPEKIRHFEQHLAEHPDDLTVRNSLGLFYLNAGRVEEAKGQFKEVLALDSAQVFAHLNLARAEIESGEFDRASEHLLEIERLHPTKSVYDALPQQFLYLRTMRRLAAHPDSLELLLSKATIQYSDGRIKDAMETLQRACQMDSTNVQLLTSYIRLCQRHDFLSEASRSLDRLVSLAPHESTLQLEQAQVNAFLSDPAKRRDWQNSRLIVPGMEQTHQDETTHPPTCDEALALWNDVNPDGTVEESKLRKAAQLYVESTQRDADDVHAYVDAAALFELLGDYKRAESLWSSAARKRPDLTQFESRAGLCRTQLDLAGNLQGCARAARLLDHASYYLLLGEPEAAMSRLLEARQDCPDNPQVALDLAAAAAACGMEQIPETSAMTSSSN